MAAYLHEKGIAVDFYHAGMTASQRQVVQVAWLRGDLRVVCATIAYGMGIDHPNVRFVVHATIAKSIEGTCRGRTRHGACAPCDHRPPFSTSRRRRLLPRVRARGPRRRACGLRAVLQANGRGAWRGAARCRECAHRPRGPPCIAVQPLTDPVLPSVCGAADAREAADRQGQGGQDEDGAGAEQEAGGGRAAVLRGQGTCAALHTHPSELRACASPVRGCFGVVGCSRADRLPLPVSSAPHPAAVTAGHVPAQAAAGAL